MKKLILIIACSILGLGLLATISAYSYYQYQINKKITLSSNEKLALTIRRGMSVSEIATYLKAEGLIDSENLLKIYLYFSKKNIQAGYFEPDKKDLNLIKLVDFMQKGSFEKSLTFIEGWRVEEYVDYLAQEMDANFAEDFANSAQTKEGFMFPDTYTIEADYEPESLAMRMRDTFDAKSKNNNWETKAASKDLTLDEVVTLASIVEREMHIKAERRTVASILLKRLNEDWPLQADATIQYAKGTSSDWTPDITGDDTRTLNSLYNTYMNKGLPPGPICNPSLDSINAVLEATDTDYWYYFTDTNGVTHYAKTLEEHNRNIAIDN